MAMFVGSSSYVPKFFKESSADSLTRKIAFEQLRMKREFQFVSFYYADGYHYAWYIDQVDMTKEIVDQLKGKKDVNKLQ